MNVRLHIELVVLDGLPVSDGGGPHLQAAIETELARLIADGGVSPAFQAGQVVPGIRGHDVGVTSGVNPTELGRQIAGAVYGGVGT
jgi:hypothetical protein